MFRPDIYIHNSSWLTGLKTHLSMLVCRSGEAGSTLCVREKSGHQNRQQRKAQRVCFDEGKPFVPRHPRYGGKTAGNQELKP